MAELLTAQEIREIREFYGLTQKSFAHVLGLGTASIVRYEQGSIPSKANANLIRAARHPRFMEECLEQDGDAIPPAQRENAMRVIYACVSLEPEPTTAARAAATEPPVSKMNEVYHYTIQQEVLNEQAANLACDVMNYMIANRIDSTDRSQPLSILLAQVLQLKKQLVNGEADDDIVLEQIRGHLRYLDDFMGELVAAEQVA